MKLAEALAQRAAAVRRVEQLQARIAGSARYQEGETPPEDASQLLVEAGMALDELESLIRRINLANTRAIVDGASTVTEALARRDVMRLRGQGYLQFWGSVFKRRAPSCLPRVEALLGGDVAVKQGNTTHDVSDELLQVLTDAYREANQRGR
jgi:hypothetical protein